jgi:hypothetical protein
MPQARYRKSKSKSKNHDESLGPVYIIVKYLDHFSKKYTLGDRYRLYSGLYSGGVYCGRTGSRFCHMTTLLKRGNFYIVTFKRRFLLSFISSKLLNLSIGL